MKQYIDSFVESKGQGNCHTVNLDRCVFSAKASIIRFIPAISDLSCRPRRKVASSVTCQGE